MLKLIEKVILKGYNLRFNRNPLCRFSEANNLLENECKILCWSVVLKRSLRTVFIAIFGKTRLNRYLQASLELQEGVYALGALHIEG